MRVRVRRARHKHWQDHINWRVEQPVADGTAVRVFIYHRHWQAVANADRLARHRHVGTYGLRGFHIEYEEAS